MYATSQCGLWTLMLTLIALLSMPSESFATRHSPAHISVDGKVVLKCGGSDNGSPDADEVWETLKTRRFYPTEHFAALQIPDDVLEFIIHSDAPDGEVGIVVDVPFGGRSETRSLRIVRTPTDEHGPTWMVDPKEVEDMYEWRTITRTQAAYLKHSDNIGTAEHLAAIKRQRASTNSMPLVLPLVAGVFIGIALTSVISWLRRPKVAHRENP